MASLPLAVAAAALALAAVFPLLHLVAPDGWVAAILFSALGVALYVALAWLLWPGVARPAPPDPASVDAGPKGGLYEETLTSDRMVFSVAVSTPGGDQMNHPPEQTGRSDPRKPGHHQPDDPDEDPSVVDLTEPR